MTGFHYPSTRAVLTGARFQLAELTASGNRALLFIAAAFFGNRVINVWNNLSHDTVDFSTVNRFKSSLIRSDLSEFLQYD